MPNSSPPDADAARLFALFNEVGIIGQLSRAMFEDRTGTGMTLPMFSVLNHLMRVGEGPTPLRLARAFQVPKTTMSHTLAALAKQGLIRMDPSPEDGRAKCVYSTEAGRAARDAAIAALAPDLARIAMALPEGLVEAALPHLTALREILDAARD